MFGIDMNNMVEWDHQQPQGHHHRHRHQQSQQSESKGFLSNLFGGKKEDDRMQTGHVYYYTSSSRPSAPRRAETISVLPAGVKMPKGDKPEVSYGADGSKYLVIPPKPKRSNSTRQIVVTSGGSTPKRKDSTASARATPRRSNSTQVKPTSPPVTYRAPKIVGEPELVKQYENSQRNVARWVESVADSNSRTPSRPRRTSTR